MKQLLFMVLEFPWCKQSSYKHYLNMQILQRYDEKKIVVGVLMKEWMKRFCPQKVLEKQYLFRSSVRFQLVFVF